jgi:hypothetical protein
MDTQPERFKDFGKRLDVFWDGDSVFYRGTVTAYSTTTRKHTILYDDNDVERVNLEVSGTHFSHEALVASHLRSAHAQCHWQAASPSSVCLDIVIQASSADMSGI